MYDLVLDEEGRLGKVAHDKGMPLHVQFHSPTNYELNTVNPWDNYIEIFAEGSKTYLIAGNTLFEKDSNKVVTLPDNFVITPGQPILLPGQLNSLPVISVIVDTNEIGISSNPVSHKVLRNKNPFDPELVSKAKAYLDEFEQRPPQRAEANIPVTSIHREPTSEINHERSTGKVFYAKGTSSRYSTKDGSEISNFAQVVRRMDEPGEKLTFDYTLPLPDPESRENFSALEKHEFSGFETDRHGTSMNPNWSQASITTESGNTFLVVEGYLVDTSGKEGRNTAYKIPDGLVIEPGEGIVIPPGIKTSPVTEISFWTGYAREVPANSIDLWPSPIPWKEIIRSSDFLPPASDFVGMATSNQWRDTPRSAPNSGEVVKKYSGDTPALADGSYVKEQTIKGARASVDTLNSHSGVSTSQAIVTTKSGNSYGFIDGYFVDFQNKTCSRLEKGSTVELEVGNATYFDLEGGEKTSNTSPIKSITTPTTEPEIELGIAVHEDGSNPFDNARQIIRSHEQSLDPSARNI